MFTVRFRAPMAEVGPLMGRMRVWLDQCEVVPASFHCHNAPEGVEIEISFYKEDDADACKKQFRRLVDGNRPNGRGSGRSIRAA
jgi:hypothetical protein